MHSPELAWVCLACQSELCTGLVIEEPSEVTARWVADGRDLIEDYPTVVVDDAMFYPMVLWVDMQNDVGGTTVRAV